jgi:hypothetical protein
MEEQMNLSATARLLIILFAAVFLVPFTVGAETSGPQRGSFPGCQRECLRRHVKQMDRLEEQYAKTHGEITFQDEVAKTVSEYSSCIENCREPYPVK